MEFSRIPFSHTVAAVRHPNARMSLAALHDTRISATFEHVVMKSACDISEAFNTTRGLTYTSTLKL
ncbi:hypothetical protein J6590_004047 [Homalodisca vitripennis]|nr:hypothetical protein J6590_004047 [Homalodisca vitripennis]